MVLQLYYPIIPNNIKEAIEQMIWFYRCSKEITLSKGNGKGKSVTQIYSFEHDDDYIYAALVKIMSYRSMDLSKSKDKEQRIYYKQMKDIYKIQIAKNEREKLNKRTFISSNGKYVNKSL